MQFKAELNGCHIVRVPCARDTPHRAHQLNRSSLDVAPASVVKSVIIPQPTCDLKQQAFRASLDLPDLHHLTSCRQVNPA